MKFSLAAAASLFAASAAAVDVACLVNGESVAVVDLDTGSCPFTVPSSLPTEFQFTSIEEYDVTFYYAIAQNIRYFTDIVNAGRVISIPANALFNSPGAPLFSVHVERQAGSNSTAAVRRRLLQQSEIVKRDAASDFADSLKSIDGVAVPNGGVTFSVVLANPSSSASDSASNTATVTNTATTVVTITSCSDNKCSEATVPATNGWTTVTTNGVVTSYTTWCPVSGKTSWASVVTVTAPSSTWTAAPGVVTKTVAPGEYTTYTTLLPYTKTVAAESTSAPAQATVAPAVNPGAAAAIGAPLLALAALPVAYLL